MMNFLMDEEGQGMVEYGLILALIAIVVIAALTGLGSKVTSIFTSASDSLTTATPAPGGGE